MQTQVRKWGNSLAVRIPLSVREQTGIEENDYVEINALSDGIVIKKIVAIPKYSLSELCSKIRPENIHDEMLDDAPVGKEIW